MRSTDAIAKIIRDLLNRTVANGNSEAEALEAVAKAHELLTKYRLDLHDIAEPIETQSYTAAPRGAASCARSLMVEVGNYCDCLGWHFDGQYRFTGRDSDVVFASWLLDALDAFCARRVLDYVANTPGAGRQRDIIESFRRGLVNRINDRLREATAGRPKAERDALQKRNTLALSSKGVTLRKRRVGGGDIDRDHFGAGQAAGNAATFNRPAGGGRPVLQIRG